MRAPYEHVLTRGGVTYWCKPENFGPNNDDGTPVIRSPARHLFSNGEVEIPHWFSFSCQIPDHYVTLWIDIGMPNPKVFGWSMFTLLNMTRLKHLVTEHNIEPKPENLDMLRVTLKLSED